MAAMMAILDFGYTSNQVLSQLAFRFRRRRSKNIFKMAAILDFLSEQF